MATINNTKSKKNVKGTKSADNITNSGSQVTINALGGNDTLTGGKVFQSDSVGSIFDLEGNFALRFAIGSGKIASNLRYIVIFKAEDNIFAVAARINERILSGISPKRIISLSAG